MAARNQGTDTTNAEEAARTERRAKALTLRKAGLSYPQIGKKLGVSYQTAYRDVTKELKEIPREAADALRHLECERLDNLQTRLEIELQNGHIAAAMPLIRVIERRARMLGLDQPSEGMTWDQVQLLMKQFEIVVLQEVKDVEIRERIANRFRDIADAKGG